jgi:hypothetical protein
MNLSLVCDNVTVQPSNVRSFAMSYVVAAESEMKTCKSSPRTLNDLPPLLTRMILKPLAIDLGVEAFIEALSDPELILKIREREPSSLQSALSTAMKLEILHRARDAAVNRSARPVYENRDRDDAFDQTSKRKERRPPAPIADHCASISHGERNASKSADSSVQLSPREDLQSKLDEALRERCAAETESRKLRAEIEALRLQQPPSATYSSFYPSNAADVAPAPPVSVMTNPPVQTIYGAPVDNANQFPMPTYQQPIVNSSYFPVPNSLCSSCGS